MRIREHRTLHHAHLAARNSPAPGSPVRGGSFSSDSYVEENSKRPHIGR